MSAPLQTPLPGFADPVFDSQSVFRTVLNALARPGRIAAVPHSFEAPDGLAPSAAAACLCLLDQTTALKLADGVGSEDIRSFLRFHTGCEMADDPAAAHFAIVSSGDGHLNLDGFGIGEPEYPDRSTTVIVQVDGLRDGGGVRLTGPGIESVQNLAVDGLTPESWQAIARNNALFPLGADILFAADGRIAGLPRSVKVGV